LHDTSALRAAGRIAQTLIINRVVVYFRAPDIIRFMITQAQLDFAFGEFVCSRNTDRTWAV